ncbi:MAG: sigma-70 family RNA polymerase sigma factor [Bacteroidota bacterium]
MENNPNLTEKGKYDYALVVRALHHGDQDAYAELMHSYKDIIFYMMFKKVHNRDDAEDITLEVFEKAFRYLDSYSPNFAFSTWLYKIANNKCIDFIHKKYNRELPMENKFSDDEKHDLMLEVKSDGLDPEENLIKKQKVLFLKKVVANLRPRYRDLVELRYFKELSYEEISKVLELPLGTVKAQLSRAKEALQVALRYSEEK